jgi:hypothetical protein
VRDGLVAGPPLRVGPCTVVAVTRVWLRAEDGRRGRWAAGGREPVAVVVRDGSGVRALDVGGGEADLAALLAEVDGLAAVLGNPTQGGEA